MKTLAIVILLLGLAIPLRAHGDEMELPKVPVDCEQ